MVSLRCYTTRGSHDIIIITDIANKGELLEKIKGLLAKPFNSHIRRHSALTEKSTKQNPALLTKEED